MDDLRNNLAYVIQGIIGDELWADADFEINGVGPASFKIADLLCLNALGSLGLIRAAITHIRDRYAANNYHSRFEDGQIDACDQIEKAMNGGGE